MNDTDIANQAYEKGFHDAEEKYSEKYEQYKRLVKWYDASDSKPAPREEILMHYPDDTYSLGYYSYDYDVYYDKYARYIDQSYINIPSTKYLTDYCNRNTLTNKQPDSWQHINKKEKK